MKKSKYFSNYKNLDTLNTIQSLSELKIFEIKMKML